MHIRARISCCSLLYMSQHDGRDMPSRILSNCTGFNSVSVFIFTLLNCFKDISGSLEEMFNKNEGAPRDTRINTKFNGIHHDASFPVLTNIFCRREQCLMFAKSNSQSTHMLTIFATPE